MISHSPGVRGKQGFTLIELMIVIAVSAILMAVVAPSFDSLSRNMTVSATASEIISGLQLARSEAARRGKPITFELNPTSKKWNVYLNKDGNPAYDAAQDELLRQGTYNDRIEITPTDATYLRFSATGSVTAINNITASIPDICLKNGDDAVRLVQVQRSGHTLTLGRDRADRPGVTSTCSGSV
jgi:type IV fimbrial biogenesis protein FimT